MIFSDILMLGLGIVVLLLALYTAFQPSGGAAATLIAIVALFMIGAGIEGIGKHTSDD